LDILWNFTIFTEALHALNLQKLAMHRRLFRYASMIRPKRNQRTEFPTNQLFFTERKR